jgi:hypothetical protein
MTHRGPEKHTKKEGRNRLREKPRRRPAVLAVVAPLFWLALALPASCSLVETGQLPTGGREASAAQAQATPASRMQELAQKDTAWDPVWPPLPGAGKPAKPIEQVRAMYAFAARHPEVLQYAPCYCGCEIGGHKNVRDCFVRGRDADGRPQWDRMGFT